MVNHEDIMKLAAEEAEKTMAVGIGGPFGAVVIKKGEVISIASNTVLGDHITLA